MEDIRKGRGEVNITMNRKKYWERNLSDQAKKWFDKDAKYFLHQISSTPVLNVMSKAHGIYIEDLEGKKYIDMHGNGVHDVGFNNPEVIEAVKKQLDEEMTHCTRRYTNIPAVRLAEKLAEIAPEDLCKVLFCPGGTDAVEMGLKIARLVTHNFKTISFWGSYHGSSFGSASIGVGGETSFCTKGIGPLVPGAFHVEFPNYYRNPWGFTKEEDTDAECLRQIELVLHREPETAAIISEPISSVVPTRRYWKGVKRLCEQYGVLLIFDEIQKGLGRTGKMFACEHYLTPDVLVLGKSLGGGIVPFAGIVTKGKYDTWGDRDVGHYTHEKNALCSAAALATIEYIEKNKLCKHTAELGEYTIRRLNEMKDRHPLVGNVTGLGLHIGVELVKDRKTKEKAIDEAEMVTYKCLERGLAFKTAGGNILSLRPALVITKEEMDKALDILGESIGEVERGIAY